MWQRMVRSSQMHLWAIANRWMDDFLTRVRPAEIRKRREQIEDPSIQAVPQFEENPSETWRHFCEMLECPRMKADRDLGSLSNGESRS